MKGTQIEDKNNWIREKIPGAGKPSMAYSVDMTEDDLEIPTWMMKAVVSEKGELDEAVALALQNYRDGLVDADDL